MSENRSALIVDDEHDIRELLVLTLGRMGLRTDTAPNLAAAREMLATVAYDLCLTDMRLPDGSGLELVGEIGTRFPGTPVAVITAYGNVEAAVEALKAGAFDFVSKPVDIHVLRGLVRQALELGERARRTSEEQSSRLLGASDAMVTLRNTIAKVARSQAPVYINGESGTGKELVARTIHAQGARAGGPFIPVNCGAIPTELMESEFFGHKKGSFTGAHSDKPGLFQAADGGTLFLDEVADLPLAMQVKLLRAIQEKAVRRIGDARETFVDVRIICATHKNLEALVDSGAFRQDLYYRLNVVTLHMPPLREMREDLGALILYLLYKHRHGTQTYKLSPKAQEALLHYSYPGNFRELENILERAVALTVGQVIQLDDLQIQNTTTPKNDHPNLSLDDIADSETRKGETLDHQPLPPFDPRTMQIQDYLDQIERGIIEQALQQTRYNRTQAAKLLGISFRSMRYRMERLDIN